MVFDTQLLKRLNCVWLLGIVRHGHCMHLYAGISIFILDLAGNELPPEKKKVARICRKARAATINIFVCGHSF